MLFFSSRPLIFHDVYAIDVIEAADASREDKFGGDILPWGSSSRSPH